MTTQHTPGPWVAKETFPNSHCWNVTGPKIEKTPWGLPIVPGIAYVTAAWDFENVAAAANARLIAAAPDFLSAAKQVIDAWAHGDFVSSNKADKDNGNKAIAELARAIAKARGE